MYTSTPLIQPKHQPLSEIQIKSEQVGEIKGVLDRYQAECSGKVGLFKLFDPKPRLKLLNLDEKHDSALPDAAIRESAVKSLGVYRLLAGSEAILYPGPEVAARESLVD